ncbi:MAG: chaperone modulator CbpM [Pseudomonadales bacterium]
MDELEYTLIEFCRVTRLNAEQVRELIDHGILEPVPGEDQWLFHNEHISRCLRAERLRQDLDLNMQGVALALELLERNQRLRQRITYLEQLFERLGNR